MSFGGIFQLIANDSVQDCMLMSTDLLNQRLREISKSTVCLVYLTEDKFPLHLLPNHLLQKVFKIYSREVNPGIVRTIAPLVCKTWYATARSAPFLHNVKPNYKKYIDFGYVVPEHLKKKNYQSCADGDLICRLVTTSVDKVFEIAGMMKNIRPGVYKVVFHNGNRVYKYIANNTTQAYQSALDIESQTALVDLSKFDTE